MRTQLGNMASRVCSIAVLSCRSFSNNLVKYAAGGRCITSKARGFTTSSSKALPLLFGATLGEICELISEDF